MNRCENYTLSCEAKDCGECDMFSWDGTGENPIDSKHILEVINTHYPNFLQDWEIYLIIDECIIGNVQNDNDILQIIDEFLTGIENSV